MGHFSSTDNGDRYRAMLNEFLFTKIEEEYIGNIWILALRATQQKLHPMFCAVFLKIALSAAEPFFFENEQAEVVTVNGDHYRAMLNKFLFTKIEEKDIGNIWLQQDGATYHTAKATLDVLRPVFEELMSFGHLRVVI